MRGKPQPLHAPPRKWPLLARLLIVCGEPIERKRLAAELWPEEIDSASRAQLRRHLHYLDRALHDAGAGALTPQRREQTLCGAAYRSIASVLVGQGRVRSIAYIASGLVLLFAISIVSAVACAFVAERVRGPIEQPLPWSIAFGIVSQPTNKLRLFALAHVKESSWPAF